jgi:hypothetical protein
VNNELEGMWKEAFVLKRAACSLSFESRILPMKYIFADHQTVNIHVYPNHHSANDVYTFITGPAIRPISQQVNTSWITCNPASGWILNEEEIKFSCPSLSNTIY